MYSLKERGKKAQESPIVNSDAIAFRLLWKALSHSRKLVLLCIRIPRYRFRGRRVEGGRHSVRPQTLTEGTPLRQGL